MRNYSLLCRSLGFFGSTGRDLGEASTELLYTTSSIHHLFTTGEEGVASTANLYIDFRLGGSDGKSISTRTGYFCVIIVVWMYFFFHEGKHTSKLEILQGVNHILLDIGGNLHHAVAVKGITRL